jgi:cytochrome o ubiquinol oxidase subunit II
VKKFRRILLAACTASFALLLGGCKMALLNPQGPVARGEMHLLIDAVLLMLIIVVPVTILVIVIAIKYRASNTKAEYKPNWCHSNAIEVVCWAVPCIIITLLSVLAWKGSHEFNPYKPIVIKGKQQITIQAIALDWKWLFIYPKQHIATINYLTIPVNTPVQFQITADAPMNSLEIPQLAGQIYAMGGMRTKLSLVADHPGIYKGLSTNYSGDGFVGMSFKIKATSDKGFHQWIKKSQASPKTLSTLQDYVNIAKESYDNKVEIFSHVPTKLFHEVIMKYMSPKSKIMALINKEQGK